MTKPKRIDLTQAELDALLERVESDTLEPGNCEVIRAMAETIAFLRQAVDQKGTSIKRLLRMIFGASTETTKNVLRELEKVRPQSDSPSGDTVDEEPEEERPKGHGRNSAADYTGADTTEISHESLKCKTLATFTPTAWSCLLDDFSPRNGPRRPQLSVSHVSFPATSSRRTDIEEGPANAPCTAFQGCVHRPTSRVHRTGRTSSSDD